MKQAFLLLSFFIVTAGNISGQNKNFWQTMSDDIKGMKLQEIQQRLDAFYKFNYRGKGSGWKQYQRWLHDAKTHLDADGRITNHAAMNWQALQQQRNNNLQTESSIGGSWYPLSMSSSTLGHSGRVNTIAFHPSDPNIVFAGTPGGGLWKSTDNGLSWNCISKSTAMLGVAAIAIHPVDPGIIYILTGDGNGRQVPTIGVLKTTDGGLNWQETDLKFNAVTNVKGFDLKMNPDNPDTLLAATSNGIYRTIDGGLNWNIVLNTASVFDIEFSPSNPDTCYAAGFSGVTNAGEIYRSVNGGGNWFFRPVSAYSPSKPDSITRIELAVTPDNSNYVYALFGGDVAGFSGLLVSTDRGSNFSLRSGSPNILGYMGDGSSPYNINQVDWSMSLSVSPDDTNTVFVGCVNVWKSSDLGSTWGTNAVAWWDAPPGHPQFVHADIHAIEAVSADTIWVCNDGGIFRSVNTGLSWNSPTVNLNTLQYYDIDGTTTNNNLFYGGLQDNGAFKYQSNTYTNLRTGDGGDALVDYSNPLNVFATTNGNTYPYLLKSTTGFNPPGSYTDISPWSGCNCQDTLPSLFIEAMAQNPVLPNLIYVINRDCWRSADGGASWTMYATGDSTVHNSVSISPTNTNMIYISNGTVIRKSLDSGFTWLPINNVPDSIQGGIKEIRVDPTNQDKLWVVCGGYLNGAKVYEAQKSGGDYDYTWVNRSAGLPNVPVLSIEFQTGSVPAIYIGTDIGVYLYTSNNGWTPFMNGLPNVSVEDLYIDQVNGYITAATFGMGLWQSTSYAGCVSFIDHSLVIPIYGQEYFEAADSIFSQRQVTGGAGTGVTYNAGNYVRMGPGFEVKAGSEAHAYIEGCSLGSRKRSGIGKKTCLPAGRQSQEGNNSKKENTKNIDKQKDDK